MMGGGGKYSAFKQKCKSADIPRGLKDDSQERAISFQSRISRRGARLLNISKSQQFTPSPDLRKLTH